MKRSLILVSVISLLGILFFGIPNQGKSTEGKKSDCNTTFRVLSKGSPVSGCYVTISGPCGSSCQTDATGECKMDVGSGCGDLTATAPCCGGSTQFTPCSQSLVIINCP